MRRAAVLFLVLAGCALPPSAPVPDLPALATHPVRIAAVTPDAYHCSGVVVHKDWALTAAHCFDDNMWVENVKVVLAHRPSADWDMLVLYAPGLPGGDVTWTDRKPKVQDRAILVGWGCSDDHKVARSVLARVESVDDRDLTYDRTVCPGDSGGPAFDLDGRLNGMIVRMVESNHHAVVQYLAE